MSMKPNREDYAGPNGLASWWKKDGAWHIALPTPDGLRWTADQYNTREQAIAALTLIDASATNPAEYRDLVTALEEILQCVGLPDDRATIKRIARAALARKVTL